MKYIDENTSIKIEAIKEYFSVDEDNIIPSEDSEYNFYVKGKEYLVLTDEERWEVLADMFKEEIITENGNLQEFMEEIVNAEGFGQLLSNYDGYEIYLGENLYAYRIQ